MNLIWFYSLLSVVIVSLISLIGVFTLSIKVEKLKRVLIYLLAFSAGALLGDAFIHLLPELVEKGFGLNVAFTILGGIFLFLFMEKIIHWQHCHMPITKTHVHSFAYMNLIGDGLHNFIDGLIIAGSYVISVPVGLATTIAVVLHEIPQEIGDFGVLLHGGFSKGKALLMNFSSALVAVLGVVLGLLLAERIAGLEVYIIALAIGGFIYIAGSDLIPELHKDSDKIWKGVLQLIAFLLGIGVMSLLLLLE